MNYRRLAIPAIAVALAGSLAACGSDSGDSSDTSTTTAVASSIPISPSSSASSVGLNEAEVMFAQGMIVHHEQAIEMAELALDPRARAGEQVVDLATRIRDAQDPEVQLMTGWLTAAGEPVAMDTSDGHDMGSHDGMMSAEQMDALATLTGDEFDRAWMEMMIAHHEGAISQSQAVKEAGTNPAVLELADAIIAAQRAEIDEMKLLLA